MKRNILISVIGMGVLFILFYKFIDNLAYLTLFLKKINVLLSPFIIGFIIAFFAFSPTVKIETFLEKSRRGFFSKNARVIAIFVIYFMFFGIITLLFQFLLPLISENTNQLAKQFPFYFIKITQFLNRYEFIDMAKINAVINDFFNSVFHPDALTNYVSFITDFAGMVFSLFMGVIISIYMLLEREALINISKSLFKKIFRNKYDVISRYTHSFSRVFYAYFTGLALDSAIVGIISVPIYYFLKAPYPIVFAVIAAISNMIPFFGPVAVAVIIYVFSAVSVGPAYALWLLSAQVILGQIDANFIQPKIIGKSVGLSPFWVIFAVLIFGGLWGFRGMILGVPIVAAVKAGTKKN